MAAKKMRRLVVRVDDATRKQLGEWAAVRGISVAEAARRLLRRELNMPPEESASLLRGSKNVTRLRHATREKKAD